MTAGLLQANPGPVGYFLVREKPLDDSSLVYMRGTLRRLAHDVKSTQP